MYLCKHCNHTFSRKHYLTRHVEVLHDGAKHNCQECGDVFNRKDNLTRHLKSCNKTKCNYTCTICNKSYSSRYNLDNHIIKCNTDQHEIEQLEAKLIIGSEEYRKKVKNGKNITQILHSNSSIIEESLDSVMKEDLLLYQNSFLSTTEADVVQLRPWQSQLMEYLSNPTDREIIWVRGAQGNEGKTFFQKYVLKLYGSRRVCLLELVGKRKNIFHILSKQSLACKDIFLFNIPKSNNTLDSPYDVLEGLKDGQSISSKYNSRILNFRTPNIVIVFCNTLPVYTKLSVDRWTILTIEGQNLNKHIPYIQKSLVEVKEKEKTIPRDKRYHHSDESD